MKKILFISCILFYGLFAPGVYSQDAEPGPDPKTEKPETEKKLSLSSNIQMRATTGQVNTPHAARRDWDAADFNFHRIRLAIFYNAAGWYGSKIELKGENLLSNSTSSIQEANIWFKPGFWNTKFTFGQFKLPFNREQLTPSSHLMLPERAFSTDGTFPQQDIGIMIYFQPLNNLDVMFSATNGDGSGQNGVGQDSVEANTPLEPVASLFNWRFQYHPFGSTQNGADSNWSEGDEIFQSNTLLSVGLAGAHTSHNESPGINGFRQNKELHAGTADFTFFTNGFYLNGEFTLFLGPSAPPGYQSYAGTFGYNFKILNFYLMPLVRYNYTQMDIDRSADTTDDEKFTDIWAGLNLYLDKNNMKMQLFYRHRKDNTGYNLGKDIIYFQAQVFLKD